MSEYELTEAQRSVLKRLPATRREVADDLGISIRSVRYRMNAMEEQGFNFIRDSDGVWDEHGSNDGNDEEEYIEEPKRVSSYQRSQATKDIHDSLTQFEQDIKDIVNETPPVVSDFEPTESNSTLVIPRSDDHFGAEVQARHGNDGFGSMVAERRINEIVDDAIRRSRERGDVEDVVLGLFGDHVDGETIYNGQLGDIEVILREQIKQASSVYVNQIRKLSDEFEHVTIATVPGNHGSLSKNSSTNADDILFDQIEVVLDSLDLGNITMKKSKNQNFVEFPIRTHQGYARHGQDSLGHLGTSSGEDRWYTWWDGSYFDVAYYGHYHTFKMEPLGADDRPVFQCGSVVPPSLFADSVSANGRPSGFYHFATDEEIVDEIRPMRF